MDGSDRREQQRSSQTGVPDPFCLLGEDTGSDEGIVSTNVNNMMMMMMVVVDDALRRPGWRKNLQESGSGPILPRDRPGTYNLQRFTGLIMGGEGIANHERTKTRERWHYLFFSPAAVQ